MKIVLHFIKLYFNLYSMKPTLRIKSTVYPDGYKDPKSLTLKQQTKQFNNTFIHIKKQAVKAA